MTFMKCYLFSKSTNQIEEIIGCLEAAHKHLFSEEANCFHKFVPVNRFLIDSCRNITEHKLQRPSCSETSESNKIALN